MPAKMAWLKQNIASLEMRGKVLVFVATRQAAEELVHLIRRITTAPLDCIHGDKLAVRAQRSHRAVQEGRAARAHRDGRGGARTGRGRREYGWERVIACEK